MKFCQSCNKSLPESLFHKDTRSKDGLAWQCKECKKFRRIKSKEKIKQYTRAYNKANAKTKREYSKQYYADHKAARAAYWKNNRQKSNSAKHKRRALINAQSFYITNKELKRIYSSECFACGASKDITLDHIIPISKGGGHRVGNILPLCKPCNSSKNDKYYMQWRIDTGRIEHNTEKSTALCQKI